MWLLKSYLIVGHEIFMAYLTIISFGQFNLEGRRRFSKRQNQKQYCQTMDAVILLLHVTVLSYCIHSSFLIAQLVWAAAWVSWLTEWRMLKSRAFECCGSRLWVIESEIIPVNRLPCLNGAVTWHHPERKESIFGGRFHICRYSCRRWMPRNREKERVLECNTEQMPTFNANDSQAPAY